MAIETKTFGDVQTVTTASKSQYVPLTDAGGNVTKIGLENFRAALNMDDEQLLNEWAFYIDVNKASSLGSARVDTGGNMGMRQMWEDAAVNILMDANGNYTELNPNDCRYTAERDYLLNDDGTVVSAFAHCDFCVMIPQTYGRVQTVAVGSTSFERLWLSLVPLPGGFVIPQQVVGKFKCTIVSGALRSLPGLVTGDTNTIYQFWQKAQVRSKNHGLANADFQDYLCFHMMSKYAYRDSQNTKGSDGTLVWGVGLDGTESTSASDKFAAQQYIKTGITLSLGGNDGKVETTDANGQTVHCVNVGKFENPWGLKWEMRGGLCSVGNDVYRWRSNFMPSGTPTADTFANVPHVKLTRYGAETSPSGMNIITDKDGQGVYMIPKTNVSGISYGDYYWYNSTGQLWLFGGCSYNGSACGLAAATSDAAWSLSGANYSARLAFYGKLTKVSSTKLKELA